MVREQVAARAVTARAPEEAAIVLFQDIPEQAEDREVFDLPRVVMQALAAFADPDPVMVGVAAQEQQSPVTDVVGNAEAQHPLEELLRLPRLLRLEHRVTEFARLDAPAGVPRLILCHSGEDFEHVPVRTLEA